jgi:hypothetical protein
MPIKASKPLASGNIAHFFTEVKGEKIELTIGYANMPTTEDMKEAHSMADSVMSGVEFMSDGYWSVQ